MKKIREFFYDYRLLLRSIPGLITTFFCISVVLMNLMASKTIVRFNMFLAVDGGFLLSWVPFLCMDTITKRFGPKAANKLTLLALVINLFCVGMFALVSITYIGDVSRDEFAGFDSIFGFNWIILLASSFAFLVSGIINNILNWLIGRSFVKNPDGKLAYVTRSYVSTFIGQFIDNFIFAYFAFRILGPIFWDGFKQYEFTEVIGSAIVGAVLELVMEVIFSPIGYKLSKMWKDEGIGNEYINYSLQREANKLAEVI